METLNAALMKLNYIMYGVMKVVAFHKNTILKVHVKA